MKASEGQCGSGAVAILHGGIRAVLWVGQTDPSSGAQRRRVVCSPTALALVLSLKCGSPHLCDVRDFSAGEQMREKDVEPVARVGKDLSPSGELQGQKWA